MKLGGAGLKKLVFPVLLNASLESSKKKVGLSTVAMRAITGGASSTVPVLLVVQSIPPATATRAAVSFREWLNDGSGSAFRRTAPADASRPELRDALVGPAFLNPLKNLNLEDSPRLASALNREWVKSTEWGRNGAFLLLNAMIRLLVVYMMGAYIFVIVLLQRSKT